MDDAEDLELREAMKSVRGGTRAWLLCFVSVALGVGGIVHLKSRLAEAMDDAAAADAKVAQRQAELAAAEQIKGELEQRVAGLETSKNELEQFRAKQASEAQAAEERKGKEQTIYDALAEKLKAEIAAGKIALELGEGGLEIKLAENALFAVDGAALAADGPPLLEKIAAAIAVAKDREVEVRVHHDNGKLPDKLKGQFPNAWVLTGYRASEIARYLQEKTAVSGKHLRPMGLGAIHPQGPNNTPDQRAKNRRIEIRLLPPEKGA